MKREILRACVTLVAVGAAIAALAAAPALLDRTMTTLDGKKVKLTSYKGKVLLIVNTASRCGYTSQYTGLEALHQKYKGRGLVVMGFPSNDFGAQEPGTNAEIRQFCSTTYKVTFPMFAKISVTGTGIDPLYRYMTTAPTCGEFCGPVQWNFTKFLVGRNGTVVARFPSGAAPDSPEVAAAIEKALQKK